MQAPRTRVYSPINAFAFFLSLLDGSGVYILAWIFNSVFLSRTLQFSVPQPLLLGLLEFGGLALVTYLIRRTRLNDSLLRVVAGAVGVAVALVTALAYTPIDWQNINNLFFIPLVYIGVLVLFVWGLGGYRASEPDEYERAYLHFRLELTAIALLVILTTLVMRDSIDTLWTGVWGAVLLFFGSGLAALALGNRETVRRETGETSFRSWAGLLVASVGIILLLGILGQGLGTGDVVATIQSGVVAVLSAVGGLLYAFMYIVVWPLSFCGLGLRFGSDQPKPQPTPGPTQQPSFLEQFQQQNQGFDPLNIPSEWQAFFIVLAALLIVAAVLFFTLRWLKTSRQDRDELFEEEHEHFGSWALFLAQLRALFERLFGRFRKPAPESAHAEVDDLAALQGRADMAGTLTIRQIYARLLRQARDAGHPRLPQQTPSEYLRVLSRDLPDLRPDLEAITSAYLDARYSPYPASSLAANMANEAWRHIEGLWAQDKK